MSRRDPCLARIGVAVFLVSLAALALQILLLRVFALRWSHPFAHHVIGTGLLGFGASGTLLALAQRRLLLHPLRFLCCFSLAFALTTTLALPMSTLVELEPNQLPVDLKYARLGTLAAMAFHFVTVLLPFLFAGLTVGLSLQLAGARAPRMYFWSLLGSGCGAPLATLGLWFWQPETLMVVFALCGILAAGVLLPAFSRRAEGWRLLTAGAVLWLMALLGFSGVPEIRLSSYKELTLLLNQPGAELKAERSGPLGRVVAVASPFLNYAPSLSANVAVSLPAQQQLFVDGDSIGCVNQVQERPEELHHISKMISYLPFALRAGGDALIVGAAAGGEILAALHAGMRVEALEVNPDVVKLMRGPLAEFSGGLYQDPRVTVHVAEARGYLRRHQRRYDLIWVPPASSLGTRSSGFATGESPLYTLEALHEFLDHLDHEGVLVLSQAIAPHERGGIRLMATAVAAIEGLGAQDPSSQLLVVRDWLQLLVLVSKSPFHPDDLQASARFLEELSFDWVHYHGVRREQVNRNHVLPEPVFYRAARHLLGRERQDFYESFPFAIAPVSDDRPFYSHHRKKDSTLALNGLLGGVQIPLGEWPYLLLEWSALQAVVFALLLLLLPLSVSILLERRKGRLGGIATEQRSAPACVYLYFAALGFGYLIIEITLLQQLSLFLAEPIYAATLVLSLLLLGSGLGSQAAD
ncbi:MAG: hypothetical protein V3T77_01725, partial [Planctomycetota bacterium]